MSQRVLFKLLIYRLKFCGIIQDYVNLTVILNSDYSVLIYSINNSFHFKKQVSAAQNLICVRYFRVHCHCDQLLCGGKTAEPNSGSVG